MFIVNILFSFVRTLIIFVGTVACCAFMLGKTGPFKWAARKIERRNAKNAVHYLSHN
jgi:hypothetical protein